MAQLLTTVLRQDRFDHGGLKAAVHTGLIARILRRVIAVSAAGARETRFGAQVREVINRNTFISLALADGFNAFLPVYDGGVDFILYRERDGVIRKVQLKGRWTIDKKYRDRDVWIAFPVGTVWYLIPHAKMLEMAETQGRTRTDSWMKAGIYSIGRPSREILAACAPYRFSSIDTVLNAAAQSV